MIKDRIRYFSGVVPSGVTLVAVSKFRPVEELLEAYEAGQRVFAESRPLEFAAKVAAMPGDVQWHFIGHLQTNKLKYVLSHCALVHSVDSVHLLEAIERYAVSNGLTINVLLEVHVARETTKGGFTPQEVLEMDLGRFCGGASGAGVAGDAGDAGDAGSAGDAGDAGGGESDGQCGCCGRGGVRICGLMGMASHTDDRGRISADFAAMQELFVRMRERYPAMSSFTELSIGMSDDWDIAVEHGATMVRIGSAIFCPEE